jgi:predicted ATP-grasp superfamily ATP-dependent carboligase
MDQTRHDLERAPVGGSAARADKKPLKVLIVCAHYVIAYRAMRCAQAAGARVFVLGNEIAKGFRYSRYCEGFVISRVPVDNVPTKELAEEINRCVAQFGIDLVIPGDAPATRCIAGLRSDIIAPCFPTADLARFDLLNDKWVFTQLCVELGILCPPSRLFETKVDLLREIETSGLAYPSMAKPLHMEGARGIVRLDEDRARSQAEAITYGPILLQKFIAGEDIGASVYCEGGKIKAFILHRFKRRAYETFFDEGVLDALTKIMSRMGVDGVYNFDMRRVEDGSIYFLECNPRVFFKMNLSMLAGINFAQWGFPEDSTGPASSASTGVRVRTPKAFAVALFTPWRLTRRDFAMLYHLYSDPIPYFREVLHIDWDPH